MGQRIIRPVSRRGFLALAGTASLGTALAACGNSGDGTGSGGGSAGAGGGGGGPRHTGKVATYVSRPDLHPPLISVRTNRGDLGGGYAFVTPGGPMIVDDRGQPLWVRTVPHAATDFRVQAYQGQPVLTWWEGTVTKWGTGTGHGVVMNADYEVVATVHAANGRSCDLHEFLLTDRTTAYITAVDEVDEDLTSVGGPANGRAVRSYVQEIDVATGALLFEWSAHRHIPLSETQATYTEKDTEGKPFSAVHLNSVNVMGDGTILVSARNTWALYKIDTATGTIAWRLGGKSSDFHLGPGVRFAWQHDAKAQPDNVISLFDDEAGPEEGPRSRGLFLHVDETAMEVTLAKAYEHRTPSLLATSQGSVQALANEDVFVGWGSEPWYTQFRADGTVALDARFETGQSYRAFRCTWAGTPTDVPAVAVRSSGQGALVVYTSWNGATEATTWQVLGGPGATALAPLQTVARDGFETTVHLSSVPPYVAVAALAADGTVLATSQPVATAGAAPA
ncbi:MAG: arylsulfotransferase family protein [Acidimicrobiales bacterium]